MSGPLDRGIPGVRFYPRAVPRHLCPLIENAGKQYNADVALVDLGPNLGSINRAALVGCDHIVIPLAPDLYSMQGLRNMGPKIRQWRQDREIRKLMAKRDKLDIALP